ncbi:DNA-directed RNA polymerase I subunit RPA49 [Mactra antiquata]
MACVLDAEKFKNQCLNLCMFENGMVNAGAEQMKFQVLSRTDDDAQKRNQRIMVAESPAMTYTGQNFGKRSFNANNRSMKHYVGIYDEERGKMRICDANLFHMIPHIPGHDTENENVLEQVTKTDYKEKLNMLTEAFGSKKRKAALEKYKKNRLDDDAVEDNLAADIDHGKQRVKTQREEQVTAAPTASTVLSMTPPCNKETEDPSDVYKLSDILTDQELEALTGPAAVFFDSNAETISAWRKEEKYPKYVLTHVQSMPLDTDIRWKRSKCLLYMSYMINLFNKKHKQLREKDLYPKNCPILIQRKLNDNFTQTTNRIRCMPSRIKDRLACYILTLCLLIDELSVDLSEIMNDLGLQRDKLFQMWKLLGCRITKKKKDKGDGVDVYMAKLKLPLDFPQKRLFKQKGGRK